MKSSLPLLAEWTPGEVRLVDPATGRTAFGPSLAACEPEKGREVVVAVGRRSTFVRALPVPAGSRADITRIVDTALLASVPLAPSERVFGFRLGVDRRVAAVGAMRAESLVRLYAEAQAASVRIRAVIPVAFGAWLAARGQGLTRAAVVESRDGALHVDLVEDGELVYSRVVPTATPAEDLDDELLRSFAIAGVAPAPVLALAAPDLPAEFHSAQEALLHFADLRSIDRLLFSLELPVRREARLARAQRWRVRRALFAGALALAASGYAYTVRARDARPAPPPRALVASLNGVERDRASAEARTDAANRANRILDVAFGPAQTPSDIVAALASGTPADAWITSLSVVRGEPMGIAGYALRGKDVGRFFDAVAKDPRFTGMQVVSTRVASIGKTPVVQFILSGNAVGTASFDRPLRRGRRDGKAQP